MQIYEQLTKIFDVFNHQLFEEILGDFIPDCVITLQRKTNMYSEMTPNSFVELETGNKINEIAINPQWFGVKPRIEILQYMVHQMVHVYQHTYGEPAGKGKHDEQFLDYMNALGLMPSDTGLPDGKSVGGKKLTNYPLPDGAFLRVANELAEAGHLITWFELEKPNNFSVDSLVKELYLKKDLLDGCVHASLLHVPLLVSQNIDVDALLDCLKKDENSNNIVIDVTKAGKLAEAAISENREQRKQQEWADLEPVESISDKPSTFSESKPLDGKDFNASGDKPSTVDSESDTGFDDEDDDDSSIISSTSQVEDRDTFKDDTAGDAADIFIKQAMANKPEKFEGHAHPGQQKVVKSTDEIASFLGLASAAGEVKKPTNKRDFKYTCSCGKIVKGGLGLSLICGHCQLHFKCENIEHEVDVVHN